LIYNRISHFSNEITLFGDVNADIYKELVSYFQKVIGDTISIISLPKIDCLVHSIDILGLCETEAYKFKNPLDLLEMENFIGAKDSKYT